MMPSPASQEGSSPGSAAAQDTAEPSETSQVQKEMLVPGQGPASAAFPHSPHPGAAQHSQGSELALISSLQTASISTGCEERVSTGSGVKPVPGWENKGCTRLGEQELQRCSCPTRCCEHSPGWAPFRAPSALQGTF